MRVRRARVRLEGCPLGGYVVAESDRAVVERLHAGAQLLKLLQPLDAVVAGVSDVHRPAITHCHTPRLVELLGPAQHFPASRSLRADSLDTTVARIGNVDRPVIAHGYALGEGKFFAANPSIHPSWRPPMVQRTAVRAEFLNSVPVPVGYVDVSELVHGYACAINALAPQDFTAAW
jgi:hypothetical protein